jgi:hypothetical protein
MLLSIGIRLGWINTILPRVWMLSDNISTKSTYIYSSIPTECPSGYYGPYCEENCTSRHCSDSSNDSCPSLTGECSGGCQIGWKGIDCTHLGNRQSMVSD